jgi:hypothetical protein
MSQREREFAGHARIGAVTGKSRNRPGWTPLNRVSRASTPVDHGTHPLLARIIP